MNFDKYEPKQTYITYRDAVNALLSAGYPENMETMAYARKFNSLSRRIYVQSLDDAFFEMFADALIELNATSLPKSTKIIIEMFAKEAYDTYGLYTAYDKIVDCIDILRKNGEI